MHTRRSLLLASAACITARTAHAASPVFGGRPDIIDFWKAHGSGFTIGDDPSRNAPGRIFHNEKVNIYDYWKTLIRAGDVPILTRRLRAIRSALMNQPSLQDIHGASIVSDMSVVENETKDTVVPMLSLVVRPLMLNSPDTSESNGRYFTRTEGAALKVVLNPYDDSAKYLEFQGSDGRCGFYRYGAKPHLLVADTPIQSVEDVRALGPRLHKDRSWMGGPGPNAMRVEVSSDIESYKALAGGSADPTHPVARMIAAVGLINWPALRLEIMRIA